MKKTISLISAITILFLFSCGPSREEMEKEQAKESNTRYSGPVRIMTVDGCDYLMVDNGYQGGVCIIHKYNCKNHTKE